jgi:hypothetical protein
VVIEEAAKSVLTDRRQFQSCALNPPSDMRGGTDVLLDDLERMTASLKVHGKIVEADAEVATPEALQDAPIGEEPIQHEAPFRPQGPCREPRWLCGPAALDQRATFS